MKDPRLVVIKKFCEIEIEKADSLERKQAFQDVLNLIDTDKESLSEVPDEIVERFTKNLNKEIFDDAVEPIPVVKLDFPEEIEEELKKKKDEMC